MKWIFRLINKIPNYIDNVWYNRSAWVDNEVYPVLYDRNKIYINCEIGLLIKMGQTKNGKEIYYKVVKMWRASGSDFLYDTDAINCKLKFSHII